MHWRHISTFHGHKAFYRKHAQFTFTNWKASRPYATTLVQIWKALIKETAGNIISNFRPIPHTVATANNLLGDWHKSEALDLYLGLTSSKTTEPSHKSSLCLCGPVQRTAISSRRFASKSPKESVVDYSDSADATSLLFDHIRTQIKFLSQFSLWPPRSIVMYALLIDALLRCHFVLSFILIIGN